MSVTTYDSSFSFRQGQVARLGESAARDHASMSPEERRRFEQSPFMMKMKEIDEKSWHKFSERDRKRKERDPNFRPQDTDFQAPKAHPYDKQVNYYKTLGIDEYASIDEVKKAYRKLSLTYHPDKTSGKSQEEKDEYATIFMEIKNAYKTLSDEPTRRQYDFERERDAVSAETNGKKPQEKASFNAAEAMRRILEKAKENQKAPGAVVKVYVPIRLEKFVFGGHKAIHRTRRVKDRAYGGYIEASRVFRVDVPPGAEQGWAAEFKRQGDQHEDREPDTLRFLFTSKPHPVVDRSGDDLRARQTVSLGENFRRAPYVSASVPSVSGRHVLLWGRNPFCHALGADDADLRVRIAGEGVNATGALCLAFRMGRRDAAPVPLRSDSAAASGAAPPAPREFLEKFGLGPPFGWEGSAACCPSSSSSSSSSALPPPLQRRTSRRAQQRLSCELELVAMREPIGLFTKPHCSLHFYGNLHQPGAPPMLALVLASPPCARQKGASDWERLKAHLVPLLQRTGFYLLREGLGLLPRALELGARLPDRAFLAAGKEAPRMPWKRLADAAFCRGGYWEALCLYSQRIAELGLAEEAGQADVQLEHGVRGPDLVPEGARVLSNRAACFAKVRDFEGSLADARRAIELAPRWARPWSRAGLAAWQAGGELRREAVEAYRKAVELDPTRANVDALAAAVAELDGPSGEAAHAIKEEGNQALRAGQIGLAVALYTVAIARLPPLRDPACEVPRPDEHALLRGVLLSNRSLAFLRLRAFGAAADDGRQAVAAQPTLASARLNLGTALLGNGKHQEAYAEFARALQIEQEENRKAKKGRAACLQEMLLWRSASAAARFKARFFLDARRPRGTTRVFALSDIHFDSRANEDWVHGIDDTAFQDDVLIVAGNVADSKVAVGRGLTTLKQKFRRVFYTTGNHEMYITYTEHARYPDSIAKLHAIISECDELGVDIFPAPVCEGVSIVPLFSWYSAEFDEQDPFPDPNANFDKHCKWPMDPDMLWKYMAKLNEAFLAKPYLGHVITFSHFLPRRGLPFEKAKKSSVKAVGCEMVDEQLRAIGSKLHVYGHARVKYAQVHAGVRYASMPLGTPTDTEADAERRLLMVFDGKSLCMQEWGPDGEPPLGFTKRVLHTAFYHMPGLREGELRRLKAAVQRMGMSAGVQVAFERIGSKKKDKEEFVKDIWPEMRELSYEATHALVLVADDLPSLKGALGGDSYRREFAGVVATASKNMVATSSPLGLDLKYERRPDATILLLLLRLSPAVHEESEEYGKLQRATDAINKMPGAEGKIAVALHPTGFGKFSHRELLDELGTPEDRSAGCTHCFSVAVDAAETFKTFLASKTYAKWRAACDACLSRAPSGPPLMAFAAPLEIAASAAAPKKERKKATLSGPTRR